MERLVAQGTLARGGGQGIEGQAESGQSAVQVGGHVLPALGGDRVDEVQSAFAVPEPVQDPGDAGQAVVETEWAAGRRCLRGPQQPFFGFRSRFGAGLGQGVEDAGRSVGEACAADRRELGYVSGEETILPFRRGGGQDRPDHGVAAAWPVGELHG
jgi:hypothetical protein